MRSRITGPTEQRTEVIAEEDEQAQSPTEDADLLPAPGPLPRAGGEHANRPAPLEERHEDADAQLDRADPDEALVSKGALDQPGKALGALPHEEHAREAREREARRRFPRDESQHDGEHGRHDRDPAHLHGCDSLLDSPLPLAT